MGIVRARGGQHHLLYINNDVMEAELWRRLVRMRDIIALAIGLFVISIVIIGLIDFDLMIEIWVKVFIGVIFIGFIVAAVKKFSV